MITSFRPMILTKKPEEAIGLFEALGFERRHNKKDEVVVGEQGLYFSSVVMKDANGFHVDVRYSGIEWGSEQDGPRL